MVYALLLATVMEPLAIDFKAGDPSFAIGTKPPLKATILNRSSEEIWFIRQFRDLQWGTREPKIQLELRQVGTDKWIVARPMGCGNPDPMPEDAVIRIPAHQSKSLLDLDAIATGLRWTVKRPGTYEFRLIIDTSAPIERWVDELRGPDHLVNAIKTFQSTYDRIPKFRWVSEVVRLDALGPDGNHPYKR